MPRVRRQDPGVSLPEPGTGLPAAGRTRLDGPYEAGLDRVCGLPATLPQFCGAFAEITVDAGAIRWLTKMLESLPDSGGEGIVGSSKRNERPLGETGILNVGLEHDFDARNVKRRLDLPEARRE